MTLQSAKLACECLCLLAVAGSAVYAVRDLHDTQVQTRGAIAASTATLEFINRPCMSLDAKGHLLPDGTLCQFNQAIHDMRKIVTQSGEQVKQTGLVITAASRNLDKAGDSVTDLTGHLTKTADAATETARSASTALQTANETIGALKAPIAASTLVLQHFDALVSNPIWLEAGKNIVGMTASGDLILADGSRVSKKFADDYTKKQTPWMRFLHLGGDALDIGASAARHF